MIQTVKEIRDIDSNELTGYLVNDNIHVPIEPKNRYYKEVINFINNNGQVELAFTEEERLQHLKDQLKNTIQVDADKKTKDLKAELAGKKLSAEQQERYDINYKLATEAIANSDYSKLEYWASKKGLTGEELANAIVAEHDKAIQTMDGANMLIEPYRNIAQGIVDTLTTPEEITLAKEYLLKANEFNLDTTTEDLDNLFAEFESALEELRNPTEEETTVA